MIITDTAKIIALRKSHETSLLRNKHPAKLKPLLKSFDMSQLIPYNTAYNTSYTNTPSLNSPLQLSPSPISPSTNSPYRGTPFAIPMIRPASKMDANTSTIF